MIAKIFLVLLGWNMAFTVIAGPVKTGSEASTTDVYSQNNLDLGLDNKFMPRTSLGIDNVLTPSDSIQSRRKRFAFLPLPSALNFGVEKGFPNLAWSRNDFLKQFFTVINSIWHPKDEKRSKEGTLALISLITRIRNLHLTAGEQYTLKEVSNGLDSFPTKNSQKPS